MGVKGLWDLVGPAGRRVKVDTLEGRVVAIDASIWLYQFLMALRDKEGQIVPGAHLIGFFKRLCKLCYYKLKPILVFDGPPPELKRETLIKRRLRRENDQAQIQIAANKLLISLIKRRKEPTPTAISQLPTWGEVLYGNTPLSPEDLESEDEELHSDRIEAVQQAAERRARRIAYYESIPEDFRGFLAERRRLDDIKVPAPNLGHFEPMNLATSSTQRLIVHDLESKTNVKLKPFTNPEEYKGFGVVDPITGKETVAMIPLDQPIDTTVFNALPTRIQYTVLTQLAEQWMDTARINAVASKDNPVAFSNLQIESFIRAIQSNTQLETVKRKIGTETKLQHFGEPTENPPAQVINITGLSLEEQLFRVFRDNASPSPPEPVVPQPIVDKPDFNKKRKVRKKKYLAMFDRWEQNRDPELLSQSSKPTSEEESEQNVPEEESLKFEDFNDEELITDLLPIQHPIPNLRPIKDPERHETTASSQTLQVKIKLTPKKKRQELPPVLPILKKFKQCSEILQVVKRNENSPTDISTPQVTTPIQPQDRPSQPQDRPSQPQDRPSQPQDRLSPPQDRPSPPQDRRSQPQDRPSQPQDRPSQPQDRPSQPQDRPSQPQDRPSLVGSPKWAPLVVGESGNMTDVPRGDMSKSPSEVECHETAAPRHVGAGEESFAALGTGTEFIPSVPQSSTRESAASWLQLADEDFENCVLDISPGIKSSSIIKRRMEINQEILEEDLAEVPLEIVKLRLDSAEEREVMQEEIRSLLCAMGIPYIIAPGEAEAQAAWMVANGLAEVVLSDDSDTLIFGSDSCIRNFFMDRCGVEYYNVREIKRILGLNLTDMRHLALLLGCDYALGVHGIGIVNALEIVAAFRTLEDLVHFGRWAKDVGNIEDLGIHDSDSALIKEYKAKHHRYRAQWVFLDEDFPSTRVLAAIENPRVNKSMESFTWAPPVEDHIVDLMIQKTHLDREKIKLTLTPILRRWKTTEAAANLRQSLLDEFTTSTDFVAEYKSKRLEKAARVLPQYSSRNNEMP